MFSFTIQEHRIRKWEEGIKLLTSAMAWDMSEPLHLICPSVKSWAFCPLTWLRVLMLANYGADEKWKYK